MIEWDILDMGSYRYETSEYRNYNFWSLSEYCCGGESQVRCKDIVLILGFLFQGLGKRWYHFLKQKKNCRACKFMTEDKSCSLCT